MVQMKIEIRDDGSAVIAGYVNATEKKSRPVITPHGKVIEEIEPTVFERAIERAANVTMTVDHTPTVYAQTSDGTLELHEDDIGLHAEARVTDPKLIEIAKAGKIKGWSFGMMNVSDELEQRDGELPLRKVKGLDLDHVTLVVNKLPAYSATSVEVRAGESADVTFEERGCETESDVHISEKSERAEEPACKEEIPPIYDNSAYKNRIYMSRASALRKNN